MPGRTAAESLRNLTQLPRAAVAEYWALLITKTHQHAPHLVTECNTLEESVALALTLSAPNPLLEF